MSKRTLYTRYDVDSERVITEVGRACVDADQPVMGASPTESSGAYGLTGSSWRPLGLRQDLDEQADAVRGAAAGVPGRASVSSSGLRHD